MRCLLLVMVSIVFAVGCASRRYDGISSSVQPEMPVFNRDVTPYKPFEYQKQDERLLQMQLLGGEWAVAKLHVFASWSPEASPEGGHPLTPDSRAVVLGRLATPAEIASLGNGRRYVRRGVVEVFPIWIGSGVPNTSKGEENPGMYSKYSITYRFGDDPRQVAWAGYVEVILSRDGRCRYRIRPSHSGSYIISGNPLSEVKDSADAG